MWPSRARYERRTAAVHGGPSVHASALPTGIVMVAEGVPVTVTVSRAATATWDSIIITHSAFKFIGVPSAFEQQMIQDQLQLYEDLLVKVDSEDRVSRKRLERLKESLEERLRALATRKDDLLTISEIGVDQIVSAARRLLEST